MTERHGKSLVGHRLGDYEVQEVIGQGGMATVYRAFDGRLDRQVAIKVLAPQLAVDARFRQRFAHESRMVAGLDHPHVIPIYEAGEADGLLFIAMRYVPGHDLHALLIEEGIPPLPRAVRILHQVAAGLDAAHEHGLVHRDVKPANILISSADGADHIYLSDFGLTKNIDTEDGLTIIGQFVGTPRYVSPEQVSCLPLTGSCDQYALGCVAYEMLTGAPPFEAETQHALLRAHVLESAPPVTARRPDLPPAVDTVVARAMAKSPDERFGTCTEFVTALRNAISAPSVPQLLPTRIHRQVGLRVRRRTLLLLAPAALVVALLLALTLLGRGEPGPKTYPGSAVAPISFRYPGSWTARTHADLFVVVSPAADAFEALLVTPKAGDWTAVDRLIGDDPESAQAIYAAVNDALTTSGSPADVQGSLAGLLPGPTGNATDPQPVTVGGQPAIRFGGAVWDPRGHGQLEYTAYLIPRNDQKTTYLVWFNAPGHRHQGTIDSAMATAALTAM